MKRQKENITKEMWYLLPMNCIKEVVKVFTYGAQKYAPNDWKKETKAHEVDISAAYRHLEKYMSGEKCAKDSGLLHLAHAIADLIIVLWFDITKEEK